MEDQRLNSYKKFVQYHETDMMGVAHHSNYIKWMEEARVDVLRNTTLKECHAPYIDYTLAVLQTSCIHKRPCRFGDEVEVKTKVYSEGSKFRFVYEIYNGDTLCALGFTLHIGVDRDLKVVKHPPKEYAKYVEDGVWTETWPSNL